MRPEKLKYLCGRTFVGLTAAALAALGVLQLSFGRSVAVWVSLRKGFYACLEEPLRQDRGMMVFSACMPNVCEKASTASVSYSSNK